MMPKARQGNQPAVARVIESPRFEVIPVKGIESQAEHLPAGAKVAVVCAPSHGIEATLQVSDILHKRGFRVAPHVPARLIVDRRHLQEVLLRLSRLGIVEIFVVGGDGKRAAGKFVSSLELLAEMAEMDHGIEHVGIAGYPEPHPFLADTVIDWSLQAKVPFASYMVSQICFDSEKIMTWINHVRQLGIYLPLYIGIPGKIAVKRLLQISSKIGVGDSARFLSKQPGLISRLLRLGGYSPDELLSDLTPYIEDERYNIAGFHINTFNQVQSTERWRRRKLESLGGSRAQDGSL